MKKLINEIDKCVKKIPALPNNLRELLVQFAPWIIILSIAVGIPSILRVVSFLTTYRSGNYFYAQVIGPNYTLMVIFLVANLILKSLSVKGLFAKSIEGWNYIFYSVLLYAVYSLLTFYIVGGIIVTAISLYLVFQIKEYYK